MFAVWYSGESLIHNISKTNHSKNVIVVALKSSWFSNLKNIKKRYRTTNIDRAIAIWTFLSDDFADQRIFAEEPVQTCSATRAKRANPQQIRGDCSPWSLGRFRPPFDPEISSVAQWQVIYFRNKIYFTNFSFFHCENRVQSWPSFYRPGDTLIHVQTDVASILYIFEHFSRRKFRSPVLVLRRFSVGGQRTWRDTEACMTTCRVCTAYSIKSVQTRCGSDFGTKPWRCHIQMIISQ